MRSYRSIRNKLLVLVLVTTFSALAAAGAIILVYDLSAYKSGRINSMTTELELLSYSTTPALAFLDTEVAHESLLLLQVRPAVREAAIYDSRGNIFATYVRNGLTPGFPDLPGEEGVSIEGDNIVMFKRIIDNGEILGTAYISADYLLIDRAINFLQILLLNTAGAMLVAVIVCLWLQSSITKPIQSIVEVARDVITSKDYSRKAEKLSEDEVGVLVDAFNEMLGEIANRTNALEASNAELEQESFELQKAREEVLRLNQELEHKVLERTQQLEVTNQELESFCYSVSHDLRGPLRSINGFSQALVEELEEVEDGFPGESRRYLDKITAATNRMGQLIEDLLNLSRVTRGNLIRQQVDFSKIATEVIDDLKSSDPNHSVDVSVWKGINVHADVKLIRIVLENLLSNSWKFTGKKDFPKIEVGAIKDGVRTIYYVRDNGAGFDMKYADKLFGAFQRLHGMDEFPGTGIGLATVQRIVHRHGGRIWFDSSPDNGAVFYFTLELDNEDEKISGSISDSIVIDYKDETGKG